MALPAGGGIWQPRKTMRDWGRTEYRIIRNWTPREQRGSGPSHPPENPAHSARGGSQPVGGEMEDPAPGDPSQEEEEDMGEEVRREGGGGLDGGLGGSREEQQQSREEARHRARQESPAGSHDNLSDASPPSSSRLMSFSSHTSRSTAASRTTQSPTVTPHPSQASRDTAVDQREDGDSGSRAEDHGGASRDTAVDQREDGDSGSQAEDHGGASRDTAVDQREDGDSGSQAEDHGGASRDTAVDQREDGDSGSRAEDHGGASQSSEQLPSSPGEDGRLRRRLAGSRARRSGRKLSNSRPRRDLGSSPVDRSRTGSTRLDETQTDSDVEPETTRPKTSKGGKSRGRGRGRGKGGRQPAEKVRVQLWQPRHTSRTARDLGELDVCLSLYHDQLREALESTESIAGERALAAHWKATQKQVLVMIRDIHIVKALERRLSKERAKSRRLQQDLLALMGTLRRTNGDYQQALERAKQAQKADELSAKKADLLRLTRAIRPLTEKFSL